MLSEKTIADIFGEQCLSDAADLGEPLSAWIVRDSVENWIENQCEQIDNPILLDLLAAFWAATDCLDWQRIAFEILFKAGQS